MRRHVSVLLQSTAMRHHLCRATCLPFPTTLQCRPRPARVLGTKCRPLATMCLPAGGGAERRRAPVQPPALQYRDHLPPCTPCASPLWDSCTPARPPAPTACPLYPRAGPAVATVGAVPASAAPPASGARARGPPAVPSKPSASKVVVARRSVTAVDRSQTTRGNLRLAKGPPPTLPLLRPPTTRRQLLSFPLRCPHPCSPKSCPDPCDCMGLATLGAGCCHAAKASLRLSRSAVEASSS